VHHALQRSLIYFLDIIIVQSLEFFFVFNVHSFVFQYNFMVKVGQTVDGTMMMMGIGN
jgi:hypothetical protein